MIGLEIRAPYAPTSWERAVIEAEAACAVAWAIVVVVTCERTRDARDLAQLVDAAANDAAKATTERDAVVHAARAVGLMEKAKGLLS